MPLDVPQPVQFWVQLVAPIVAIVGATMWMVRAVNRLDRRLEHVQLQIGTVEYQNRALLKAFPPVISSLIAGQLSTIQPISNPLSQDELTRLRGYVQRLRQGGLADSGRGAGLLSARRQHYPRIPGQ